MQIIIPTPNNPQNGKQKPNSSVDSETCCSAAGLLAQLTGQRGAGPI